MAVPETSDLDSLPTPRIDGAAAIRLWDDYGVERPRLGWRSSLLSLLTHILFVALLVSLVHWMGKEPPEELPSIAVSLAPDPTPPPPPAAEPKRDAPKPPPPAPLPPPLPRASDASSIGDGAPQAAKQNEAPTANPAPTSTAPRDAEPAPRARPTAEQAAPEPAPKLPEPPVEPIPPAPPLPREAEPAPNPMPPVMTAPQSSSSSRPAPAPRPAPPPPSVALRKPLAPSQAPAAEPKPQTRSAESEAPPPSPHGLFDRPGGPLGAVYDAYLDAIRNKMMEQRRSLAGYFEATPASSVEVHFELDAAGRYFNAQTNAHNFNMNHALENMVANAAPFPPPPPALLVGGRVGIIVLIPLPSKYDDWKKEFL
jgi:hypothetical protein